MLNSCRLAINNIHHFGYSSRAVKALDFFSGKFDYALSHGIKGIIFALTDIFAGDKFTAALADYNTAGLGRLSVK